MRLNIFELKYKYGGLASYGANIYTGCPHRCAYCKSPRCLNGINKEDFHSNVMNRDGIVHDIRHYMEWRKITGKTVLLCPHCDPYPTWCDSTCTRSVIQTIKQTGNHVCILTKGDGTRDFDMLDSNDWYGVSISGKERMELDAISEFRRLNCLAKAYACGINTFVAFAPVLDAHNVMLTLRTYPKLFKKVFIDKLDFGYCRIDWKGFGKSAEAVCQELRVDYHIMPSLRREMNAENGR